MPLFLAYYPILQVPGIFESKNSADTIGYTIPIFLFLHADTIQ